MKFKFNEARGNLKEDKKRSAKINTNDIKGITLLSVAEAEALPQSVRAYSDWWWLRSPGGSSRSATCVGCYGSVFSYGYYVDSRYGAVRPALLLNLKSLNFKSIKNGDIIEVFNKEWYYQDGLALLMDKPLTAMAFRKNWKAEGANDYEKSDVKKYLDNWLKNALSGDYNYAIIADADNDSGFSDDKGGESDYTDDEEEYEDFMAHYKDINDDLSREEEYGYDFEDYCDLFVDPEDLETHPDWVEDAYEDYVNLTES